MTPDHRSAGRGLHWPISGARSCNQTVMSGSISVSFVDSNAFSSQIERVRCVLAGSFLVRNWCGTRTFVAGNYRSHASRMRFWLLTRQRKRRRRRGRSVSPDIGTGDAVDLGFLIICTRIYGVLPVAQAPRSVRPEAGPRPDMERGAGDDGKPNCLARAGGLSVGSLLSVVALVKTT